MSEEKYYTLDELMQDKKPGEILVTCKGGINGEWFKPYFKAQAAARWYGLSWNGYVQSYYPSSPLWKLYVEPKKKVVRWLWAVKISSSWCCTHTFCTEEEADERWGQNKLKLDFTRTEFDE